MRETTTTPVVILSAEQAGSSWVANRARTRRLHTALKELGFGFHAAYGVWEGKRERSFVVAAETPEERRVLYELAFDQLGQDAVLTIDKARLAYLRYRKGNSILLGPLLSSDRKPEGGYTYVPSLRTYYYTD